MFSTGVIYLFSLKCFSLSSLPYWDFWIFGGGLSISALIVLSAALAAGAAINMPNWVALAPEVLPKEQLASAGALNSISMSLSGALGPALGGALIATLGTGWVFLANAISFIAVVFVLVTWRREPPTNTLPAEHVVSAVRTGFRYALHERTLQVLLLRIAAIALPATALIALLPLIARQRVGVTSAQYGLLGAAGGLAAVGVASILPSLRARFGPDEVAMIGTLGIAVGLVLVGLSTSLVPLMVGSALSSAGQIGVFSTTFSILQINLPGWVRGRGLATALFVFQGVSVIGALGWGALGSAASLPTAMFVAAGIALLLGVAVLPIRLARYAESDLTPRSIESPLVLLDVGPEDGPVLVSLHWRIDPATRDEFTIAMRAIRRLRRRDGAIQWGLFEQMDAPGVFVEHFVVSTWAEHERQHHRETAADVAVNTAARRFRIDDTPLVAEHRISTNVKRRSSPSPSLAELLQQVLPRR
jgi:MFS family permease